MPIAVAAKVLGLDAQTVRLMLQSNMVDWGCAYKRPGSTQYSYLIYAQLFYKATGYIYRGEK